MQSYFFYLRLNIKTFSTLLELYRNDVKGKADESLPILSTSNAQSVLSQVTALTRHVLPALRLYSAWLLTNSNVLSANVGDEALTATVNDFWEIYTKTLSSIAAVFSVQRLPEVTYQLEEDVETIGFKPLEHDLTRKLWNKEGSAELKPRYNDASQQRILPDLEMLARIRELQIDGLLLAVDKVSEVQVHFLGRRS